MNNPVLLIAGTGGALATLRQACERTGVIDHEILLAQVIDCMISADYLSEELIMMNERILDLDESICQAPPAMLDAIDRDDLKQITVALSILTECIHEQVTHHGLYNNSFFRYEFARIADDDNLLLSRVV